MTIYRSGLGWRVFPGLLAGAALWMLSFASGASAQSLSTIDAGTTITVRTNEAINTNTSDGRVFSGFVDQDVVNRGGNVAIPRGANVELLVRSIARNQVALDLESVTVDGQRYGIQTEDAVVNQRSDGIGANKRTGEFVGGGAAIGAIIGAIAGGGKGAAIGGGIGAAAGAGTQVLTRGNRVNVPAESLVTFRLEQPLQTGAADSGFRRNGQHYHPGANMSNSVAYQDGFRAGRSDSERSLDRSRDPRSNRWARGQQFRDYQSGYGSGYDGYSSNSNVQPVNGSITVGSDRNVSWRGPANGQVYVQVDNRQRQLFASGASGTQLAPWIMPGHLYVFVLQSPNGTEIARDQSDLRRRRN